MLRHLQRLPFSLRKITPTLRAMWTDELTAAEMRHSVSNLVAPFVLADGLVQSKQPGAETLRDDYKATDSDQHSPFRCGPSGSCLRQSRCRSPM